MRVIVSLVIIFICLLIAYLGGYSYGFQKAMSAKTPERNVSLNRIDVYNVYMLKSCLQELKTLKGGE